MSVRRDIFANYAGRAATVLSGIVVLPLYRELLGADRFGVVAFFATLQSVLSVLDAGLGAAFLQRLSRCSADPARHPELRDVATTFAWLGVAVSAVTGTVVVLTAPVVTRHVLRVEPALVPEATRAMTTMAIVLAAWWPTTLSVGALLHLDRQPESNALSGTFALLRAGATYLVLSHVDSTLDGYVLPQAGIAIVQVLTLVVRVRAALPMRRWGRARLSIFREELPNALALGGTSLLGVVAANTDRFALASLRPVADVGTYAFATLAITAVSQLIGPIHATFYPRLCADVGDAAKQERTYLQAVRVASLVVIPAGCSLAAFAPTFLLLWTRDPALSDAAAPALSLLAVTATIAALTQMFVALCYATQRAGEVFKVQLAAAAVFLVTCPLAVQHGGTVGAAGSFLAVHGGQFVVLLRRAHASLRGRETTREWLTAVLGIAAPVLAITLAGGLATAFTHDGRVALAVAISGTALAALPSARALRRRD